MQYAIEDATDKNGNVDWQKALRALQIQHTTKYNTDWKNQLSELAGKFGVTLEQNEDGSLTPTSGTSAVAKVATGLAIAGGGLALEKGTAMFDREYKPMTKDDLKNYEDLGDGNYKNSKGELFSLNEKGQVINAEGEVQTKFNPKKQGVVSKTWKGLGNITNDFLNSRFSKSSPEENTSMPNDTGDSNNSKTNKSVENNITNHGETPSNKDSNIIPQEGDVSATNTPSELKKVEVPKETIEKGDKIQTSRGSIGEVLQANKDGSYAVHFVNKQRGTEVTVRIPKNEITNNLSTKTVYEDSNGNQFDSKAQAEEYRKNDDFTKDANERKDVDKSLEKPIQTPTKYVQQAMNGWLDNKISQLDPNDNRDKAQIDRFETV